MIDKREDFNLGSIYNIDEIIAEYDLDKNVKILDIGCGSGNVVNYLEQKGFDVIGIDISKETIKEGKEKYKNIDIRVMDSHSMNFENNTFNVISLECSLSIMKDPKLVLSNCKKILKDKGVILLSDFFFKDNSSKDKTYTLEYWNKLYEDLDLHKVSFKDKSKEWKNYIGKVLWEYGNLTNLLRGCENCELGENILSKNTGYFLVTLRKKGL